MTIDAYTTVGTDREYDLTPEALVRCLDAALVDRAIIAPVDRAIAVYNREGNDHTCGAARLFPDRLIPACTVNPWFGPSALSEFRRSIGEGARLLVLHPSIQGFQINDELVWSLAETAQHERIPIYVHTGPPASATPWMLVDLAQRFRDVDFIMGHCGATDFWADVVPAAVKTPNIVLESSLSRPFLFACYMAQLDPSRGMVGSYAPNNDLCFEWDQMRKVLAPNDVDPLCGGNLLRLLRKRGPL